MTVVAVLQARVTSSRLPGKVLKPLLGRPMLLRQLERIGRAEKIDRIVVATSHEVSDDLLEEVIGAAGYTVYRGNLDNVLDRFYGSVKSLDDDSIAHVVRLTGDCPLVDPQIIDRVIESHLQQGNDYTSNVLEPTWPDGLDVEVMTLKTLYRAHAEASLPSELEHVTSYIYTHPDSFRIGLVKQADDLSAMRWTVDEPEDLNFVESVYERLYSDNPNFGMQHILDLLEGEPHLSVVNDNFERNEGLKKSLKADKAKSNVNQSS
ncbi:MAG: spore coat protein [Rhodospirillaceae bacterium]|nr:spore coat protein [Rhodospirillaceae bacterium]